MPNLVPPVTTVQMALEYKQRLLKIDPTVTYLMTLYLHPSITPEVVREAKRAGIAGIKSYPAGLTTNSESGVTDYQQFYPVFAAMEEEGIILVSSFWDSHAANASLATRRPGEWVTSSGHCSRSIYCPYSAVDDETISFGHGVLHPSLGDNDAVQI